MKLDEGEIKDLVADTERKRSHWATWADEWERLWRLCDFTDDPKDYRDMDGVRAITMPDPFNIIQLLQRFVAAEQRVEIPSLSPKEDDDDRSEVMEEWALAFDTASNIAQGRNFINDVTWQSGTLGRGAAQVLWIGDIIPNGVDVPPIVRRILDPRNVGVARGPYWTDYAYHKYKTTRSDIEQRYPKFKLPDESSSSIRQGYWNKKYEVIDFWSRHKGAIWHAVTIDGKFAIKPVATDYPDVPVIEWYADGAPVDDEMGKSLGMLHAIRGPYQAKNDFISTMATGLEYHYNPLIVTTNMDNDPIRIGPGQRINIAADQKIEAFRAEPNVPMAQALLQMLQVGIDQATFSSVTYGEQGGGASGYAINSLSQQARARANIIRGNLEAAMSAINQLVFGLVEAFAPDEGVTVYGRSERSERGKLLKLNKRIIKGNYANRVMLIPEQPMDDNAKIMAWLQMVEKGVVSMGLMRNRVVNVAVPRDEETRIAAERALKSPQMQLKTDMRAMQATYPQKEWDLLFLGTEYEQLYMQEKQYRKQKAAEEAASKERKQLEKEQANLQGMLANMPLPPGMGPGQPPMGMPPDPSMMPPGMPPQDMGMQPPGLPGMPPEMGMQMTPESLGLPPQGGMPGQFQQMMGQPELSDQEMMQRMGGLPPAM